MIRVANTVFLLMTLLNVGVFAGRVDRSMSKREIKDCKRRLKWTKSAIVKLPGSLKWLARELRRNKSNPDRLIWLTELQRKYGEYERQLKECQGLMEMALKSKRYKDFVTSFLSFLRRELMGAEIDMLRNKFYRSGSLGHWERMCTKYQDNKEKVEAARKILNIQLEHWNSEIQYREAVIKWRKERIENYRKRALDTKKLEDVVYQRSPPM